MNTLTTTPENNNIDYNSDNFKEVVSTITRKEFCIIWKKISNDKRVKPSLVEHNTYGGHSYKTKEKGWIYPEHHIIYNVIRGLPVSRGFKENTEGYNNALNYLKSFYHLHYITHLHKPFEEFITADNFKLLLLEIKALLN